MGLIGCAQFGDLDDLELRQQRWQIQQNALREVEQWDMYARAVFTLPEGVYNIGFQWQRKPDRFLLLLEAPFGQGLIQIQNDAAGYYRLRLPDGQVFLNDSPERLLKDVIGWSIPISGLEYWIRGMPRPQTGFTHRIDNSGLARKINQDNWVITYTDYYELAEAPLPRRLRLTHEEITLKLSIDRWQQAEIEDSDADLFPEFN